MNLLQIRTQFRKESGRFDLVNVDNSDNGVDFYINAAQRHLDRLADIDKAFARVFKTCAIGSYHVNFPYCRSIKEVWCATTESRWQLEKKSIQDLRIAYPEPFSVIGLGDPLYYSPALLRLEPDPNIIPPIDLAGWSGYADVMIGDHYHWNGALFLPPCSELTMIEVWGQFYSPSLDTDASKSFWSEVHPEALLMATYRQLEIVNRNTQGVKDWDASIATLIFGAEKDKVEEEMADAVVMEG